MFNYFYVWCLMADDGFYMEPDISLIKVFLTKSEALKYIKKNKNKHKDYFIEKKRVDLK